MAVADDFSTVTLTTGDSVDVKGRPEQVIDLFKGGHLVAGMARLTDTNDQEVWVNPVQVVSVTVGHTPTFSAS